MKIKEIRIIKPVRHKKYKFPENPTETEFMKIWHETIEREDFKELKREFLEGRGEITNDK